MSPKPTPAPLPPFTVVADAEPRSRAGAVEPSEFVSAEWAREVRAASNRAWTNAAKIIAAMAAERPDARYVEGWASQGAVSAPVWHAWVDVPLDSAQRAWMRIDATPMWRWMLQQTTYAPVVEVRAAALLPFVVRLTASRGKASCRLPIAPLVDASGRDRQPRPTPALADELGAAAHARSEEARRLVTKRQRALTADVHADGQSELDRLAAMRVLPPAR